MVVAFGLGLIVVAYVLARIGWLYIRRAVARSCLRAQRAGHAPWVQRWMDRQAAWSFAVAWKKLWGGDEDPGAGASP
jgi:hypothetical protein